jgi:NhaP-type Na+/H+ or K+/H+ antiporter
VLVSALVTAVFGLVVVAYVSASRRLERWNITAPIVFTLVGAIIGSVTVNPAGAATVHTLAELTLALILFHDAAQVRPRQLESDAMLCGRLLLVGLPLTILLGFVVAWLLMPGIGTWLALFLAASLAPTDAGLGAATVLNPVVPVRIRRVLNVESGLNDGLATPVVLFAIAAAGGTEAGSAGTLGAAVAELAVGVLVGAALGAGCGRLLSHAQRFAHIDSALLSVATLAVPLACYYGSVAIHGNGFVAAFVSGTAFASGFAAAAAARTSAEQPVAEEPLELTASVSTALGYAVWGLFGVVGVAHLPSMFTWRGLVFAVLSLTVLRLVPVALVLVGSRLQGATVLFVGWFGPRGLASVIFALIAVEALPATPELEAAVGTVTTTVLLSVVLHGLTADPGARRYGGWVNRTRPVEELKSSVEPRIRSSRLHQGGQRDSTDRTER